jgi:hypothetical protein
MFILLIAVSQASAAGPATPVGKVEVIVGAGPVQLERSGKTYAVRKDTALYENDGLKTGDHVALRIRYREGSSQIMASKTHLKLHFSAEGVPAPEFIEGAVDNVIPPTTQTVTRPRFLIRAKSVILGVRGTDFVVHTGPKGLEIHTLEGVVEAGREEKDLFTPKAVQIKKSFEVKMNGDEFVPPSAFVPAEFLAHVAEKYPEVAQILKLPAR